MPKTLEESIEIRRQGVKRSLSAAIDWRAKKSSSWELYSLYQAIQHCLSIAVLAYPTEESGIGYLRAECKTSILDRAFELLRELHIDERASLADSPPPGIHSLVLGVHAAWLLDSYKEAKAIASICVNEDRLRFFQSTPFWRDYAKGINAVAQRRPYMPRELKLSGYEKHWATYCVLMSDICSGNDPSTSIALVEESFARRNKDKRVIGDGLDGDGTFPVKWDFRKHSLLKARTAEVS
jgi:hypothetical protein